MPTIPNTTVSRTNLTGLELVARGKVRDIYALGDTYLLLVATDRLSAYDVVFDDAIPGKGAVLTALSDYWLAATAHLCTNHSTEQSLRTYIESPESLALLESRARVVRRTRPLPVEAVVRGYLAGSGWAEYAATGAICGEPLPAGLRESDALPRPVFTPATKAAVGDHDENISFATLAELIGKARATEVRDVALALYEFAADRARQRGIIIADTKFEFGLDENDELVLIDEVLTPDSSRFWPAEQYAPGSVPPSFDKQFVRDYTTASGWNRQAPAPRLPTEIIAQTRQRYIDALEILTE
ncbi:MAG: phosphoribosylaminoimidazolesuccinocarboxamide synthase [Pseudomonadota bacterium]